MSASKWAISLESAVELLVFARRLLLGFESVDGTSLAFDFELNLAALNLVFLSTLLGVFEKLLRGSQLRFQPFPFSWQRLLLLAQCLDFLVAILKDKQGFEFGLHGEMVYRGLPSKSKEPRPPFGDRGSYFWQLPTLAQPRDALPSGLRRFTSVFGMGTGGTTAQMPPEVNSRRGFHLDQSSPLRAVAAGF